MDYVNNKYAKHMKVAYSLGWVGIWVYIIEKTLHDAHSTK